MARRRTGLTGALGVGSLLGLLLLGGSAAAQVRGPLAPLSGARSPRSQTITIRTEPARPGAAETRITVRDGAGVGAPGPVNATAAAPGTRTTRITVERDPAPPATARPASSARAPVGRSLPGGAGPREPRGLDGASGSRRDPGPPAVHPLLLAPRLDRSIRITVSDGSAPSGPVPIPSRPGEASERRTVTIRTDATGADLGLLIVVD